MVLAACHPHRGRPEHRVFETEHFEYFADDDYCPEVADWMEEHFAAHATLFGFSLPEGEKISYFRYADGGDIPDCKEASGCADGLEVSSGSLVEEHELIHAYASTIGRPPRFFREGLAVAMSGSSGGDDLPVNHDAPVEAMLTDADLDAVVPPPAAFDEAASFTRYLIEKYGVEAYVAMYANLDADAERDEVDAAFEDAFDEELDTIVEDWHGVAGERRGDVYENLTQCARGASPLDGTDLAAELTCSEADLGFGWDRIAVGSKQHVRLDDGAALRVMLTPTATTVSAQVAGCGTYMPGVLTITAEADGHPALLWADVGLADSRLTLRAPEGMFDSATIASAMNANPPLATECDAAATLELPSTATTVRISSQQATAPSYIRLHATTSATVFVSGTSLSPSSVAPCTGPCDSLVCGNSVLALGWGNGGDPLTLPAGSAALLKVEPAPASEAVAFDLEVIPIE